MTDFSGLIRDFNGKLVCGFHGDITYSNIVHAEILTLVHGIQILTSMHGFKTMSISDMIIVLDLPGDLHLLLTADNMRVAYHCSQ